MPYFIFTVDFKTKVINQLIQNCTNSFCPFGKFYDIQSNRAASWTKSTFGLLLIEIDFDDERIEDRITAKHFYL